MISGRMVSSWLISAILVLIFLSGTSASSQEVITSISGRNVPVHLIQAHFEKPVTASDQGKNFIYELTDENVLQGPGLHIDLRSDVSSSPLKRSSVSPTVTLNGHVRGTPSLRLKTLKAKSYNIIIDDESGRILAVTGNGIALAPLHRTELPGILVNKMAFSKGALNLGDDLRLLEEAQDLRNSSTSVEVRVDEQDRVVGGLKASLDYPADVSTRQGSGSCASGTTHYLEVAVAYDNTFCALYSNVESTATAAVQMLVDDSNVAYGMNTCVQLALVHVEAHCNDPDDPYDAFTTFTSRQILDAFRSLWNSPPRVNVARDAAYLITGFMDGTSTAGVAFVGVACNLQAAYGWIEGPRTIVFAHEIGHTIDGDHTSAGIMRAVIDPSAPFVFAAESASQFANFVDNGGGSTCMGTTRPPGPPGGTFAPPTSTVPSPSPRPIDPSETCAAGFNRRRALRCRARRVRQVNFTLEGEPVGRLRIFLAQRNGRITVRYRVNGQLFIERYRDTVSTIESDVEDLGSFETPTGTVRRADSSTEANGLPLPSGSRTCCGRTVFVGSEIRVCLNSEGRVLCQTVMDIYSDRLRCQNICRGNPSGVFTPMSAGQACPSCV